MSRAGAAFAGAFVLLGATLLLVTRGPQSAEPTELYFDYDAPDETFAKSLNLDPDSLQKGDTGHTLDEEIGIIQTMIKKATVMNGRLKKRAVKAAPVSINVKAGQKGPPGGRGPRGYRGPRGRTGSAGRPGARGSPGRQGPPGIKGPRGTVGAIGHRGAMGPRGPRGKQGDPGRPGRPGRDGRQGPNGRPGPDGRPGAPGHNGRPGPPGAPAAAGLPGPRGTRGPPGPPGARGPPGVIGRPGATGHTGPRGNNGRPGTAGAVGARGVAGHPRWTLAAKFRVNNNEWQYDSAWWTNRNVYRANDRSDNKNVKTSAFVNKRLTAIKIEMNLRTYIFEMKTRYAGHWTLRDLVSRRQGYQFREPRWKASRLDAFGIAGEKDPSTPNLWYCNNMAAHYTPYYQASIDSRSKCGAVSRFGALLSNSAACAVTNRARPVVAEGVGLKYTCKCVHCPSIHANL